jgi:hypothetical protein
MMPSAAPNLYKGSENDSCHISVGTSMLLIGT